MSPLISVAIVAVASIGLAWGAFLRRQIRARVVAEESYRGVFQNAVEGMFQTSPAGRYIAVNPALARIYGFESSEALIAHFSDIANQLYVNPDRRGEFIHVMETEGVVSSFESEVFRANGERIWISENARAVRSASGRIIRYEGTVVDVTLRRRAAEALRHAKESAEEAARLKAEFLATMSHELRTPLNVILGFAEMARDPEVGHAERAHFLDRINTAGTELLELVESTLEIGRIDAGRDEVRFETVFLPKIWASLKDACDHMPRSRSVTLNWLDSVPDVTFSTDVRKFTLIVRNVVSNALKFTEEGHVRVEACLDGQDLVFKVADTGIGIHPAEHLKIFEMFRQADGSDSRRYGGTGLGLYLVRRFVGQLGGEIDLDSTPGRGSLFTVRLAQVVRNPGRSAQIDDDATNWS